MIRGWLFASLCAVLCMAGLASFDSGSKAVAQGLIVSLPTDGAWVRFEGTVKEAESRPNAPEGDITMDWIQHLTIKSVGSESATFRGREVPCRWIEIKVVTGKSSEAGVDAGPVGSRLYKVLVPEERVVGQFVDNEKVPFSFLDIVKGTRKIGPNSSPIPGVTALQVFPLIAPMMHYETVEPGTAGIEEIKIGRETVKTQKYKAKRVIESPTLRTTCEAEIWRCEGASVPFGLVKWISKTTLEKKDNTQPRSAFKTATTTNVEMSAHESGIGAKSELASAR